MKKIILITFIAALFVRAAAAQDRNIPFKDLPQNVKSIIAADLNQYAATIDNKLNDWLENPDYTDDVKHQLLKGRADTYAYYLYCVNGRLTIEAIEKYAAAGVDSVGEEVYGTTVLYTCTDPKHRPSHSTTSVRDEPRLRKKYGCTGFTFKAY